MEFKEKKFTFSKLNLDLNLNLDQIFVEECFQVPELIEIENLLNQTKIKLSDFNLNEWSSHTNITEESSLLKKTISKNILDLDKTYDYENNLQILSTAWIKFFQILYSFNFKKKVKLENDKIINTLFFGEAPGSFIVATNNYFKSYIGSHIKLNWIACSLNPYYEKFNFALSDYTFINKTFNNWYFGEDDSGDIRNFSFKNDFENKLKIYKIKNISLISCDGSIDCTQFFDQQEKILYELKIYECLTALNFLDQDGNFVIKYFTFTQSKSICLMYFLSLIFKEFHVSKPNASKSGNSEVYFVCIGYEKQKNENLIKKILLKFDKIKLNKHQIKNLSLFKISFIHKSFLDEVIKCAIFFNKIQIKKINKNLELFGNLNKEKIKELIEIKYKFSKKFLNNIKILPIKLDDRIIKEDITLKNYKISEKFNSNYGINYELLYSIRKKNFCIFDKPITQDLKKVEFILNKLNKIYSLEKISIFEKFHNFKQKIIFDLDLKYNLISNLKKFYFTCFCNYYLIELFHDICLNINDIKLNLEKNSIIYEKIYLCQIIKNNDLQNFFKLNEMFQKLFKNLIKLKLKNNEYLSDFICPQSSKFKTELENFIKVISKKNNLNLNTINLKIIAYNCYLFDFVENEFDCENIFEFEYRMSNKLLKELNNFIKSFKKQDFLIFKLPSILTRYTISIIYLLKEYFQFMTIFPFNCQKNMFNFQEENLFYSHFSVYIFMTNFNNNNEIYEKDYFVLKLLEQAINELFKCKKKIPNYKFDSYKYFN